MNYNFKVSFSWFVMLAIGLSFLFYAGNKLSEVPVLSERTAMLVKIILFILVVWILPRFSKQLLSVLMIFSWLVTCLYFLPLYIDAGNKKLAEACIWMLVLASPLLRHVPMKRLAAGLFLILLATILFYLGGETRSRTLQLFAVLCVFFYAIPQKFRCIAGVGFLVGYVAALSIIGISLDSEEAIVQPTASNTERSGYAISIIMTNSVWLRGFETSAKYKEALIDNNISLYQTVFQDPHNALLSCMAIGGIMLAMFYLLVVSNFIGRIIHDARPHPSIIFPFVAFIVTLSVGTLSFTNTSLLFFSAVTLAWLASRSAWVADRSSKTLGV